MIFLSIVIPVYNCSDKIISLLSSLKKSQKIDFREIELVIVDDKSTDDSVKLIRNYLPFKDLTLKGYFKECKVICLKKNSGPAKARNVGVSYAKGKVILFLDGDVEVYSDTLFEVINAFKTDQDLFALTGVWDKTQRNHNFFPRFKALRDWSYWINERDPKNYYYLFSTRIAAIKRDLFLRLKGFDTTYKAALVEDIELTYRIAKRYAVVFDQKVKVHHEFENFWPIARKYFWRSYFWSRIYRERKKFDPVATTGKEAVTTLSAGGLVVLGVLTLISYLGDLSYLGNLEIAMGVVTVIHLWGVRKFLWFTFKEEGVLFMVKSFITGVILYIVILLGAVYSLLKY